MNPQRPKPKDFSIALFILIDKDVQSVMKSMETELCFFH